MVLFSGLENRPGDTTMVNMDNASAVLGRVIEFGYEGAQRIVTPEELKFSAKSNQYYIVGRDATREGAYRSFHIARMENVRFVNG